MAISRSEKPCETGTPTSLKIVAPRSDRPSQEIRIVEVVEAEGLGSWPFDVVRCAPFGSPEALPLPVHAPEPECCPRPAGEGDPSGPVAVAESPGLDDEVLLEVFPV